MRPRLFLGLLLFFLSAISMSAQTKLSMSVASFEQDPFDTTPQNPLYEKIDGSGARYAIIKVSTNNPDDRLKEYNFNFGNLKSTVEEHDDELWVYVQKNAKMVTISRNGYRTISKYDLETTIEAGKTYVMLLNVARPVLYTQMVKFVIKPENSKAIITVKGSTENAQEEMFGTADESTGAVAKALPLGIYTYKIIAENYHTSEGRFTLNDRKNTHEEEVTLRPNFSEITLTVDADADIYVNNEKKGKRTWTGALRAGDFQVECRQDGHRTSSQLITVEANQNRTFQLNAPTPITGTLSLTSKPLGATITIDGTNYGQTPKNITDLLIGNHNLRLSLDRYQTATQSFMITENQTTELNVALERKPVVAQEKPKEQPRVQNQQAQQRQKVVETPKPYSGQSSSTSFSGYIQPAFQAGTMMGFGGNAGFYISGFNIEAFATLTMGKEALPMYNTSTLATSEANLSGTMFGAKIGYGIKAGSSVRITPQVGVAALNVSGDDVASSAICATAGARVEIDFAPNFGVSLTPEGQFAVSKKEVFERLEEVSSKIKGWGTGANLRVGLYLKF